MWSGVGTDSAYLTLATSVISKDSPGLTLAAELKAAAIAALDLCSSGKDSPPTTVVED